MRHLALILALLALLVRCDAAVEAVSGDDADCDETCRLYESVEAPGED